jgi:hypothetical protein
MKLKSILSSLLFFTICTFSACELADKPEDIAFDVIVPISFSINDQTVNATGKSYSEVETLDATVNPDVALYSDKIKEFVVNKITYTISGANPTSVTFADGVLKISATDNTIATAGTISLANTAETNLNLNSTGISELATKLLDDKQEIILLQGTLSKTPVTFNITFKFYLTTKADATK